MNHVDRRLKLPGTQMLEKLAALSWDDLSPRAPRSASLALLDNIACGVFGTRFQWTQITSALALEEKSTGRATLFGSDVPVTPARAALSNGTSIHGFELDDIVLGSLVHPGSVVVPAALAIAEEIGASGDRLLLGIIAGYEAMARVGAALGQACNTAGFHSTSVAGPIGAAVACAVVSGASYDLTAKAVGIAASTSSGIKAFTQGTGGMVKRVHGGLGAQGGVLAWQLASRGMTGPAEAIDGRYGLLEVIGGPTSQPALLAEGLGSDWAIDRVWTKVYSCCGVIHTTAQALESIREEGGLAPRDVDVVKVKINARAVSQNAERNPTDAMNAQYSLPFCAALALVGDIRDPNAFLPPNLDDPQVRSMSERIELHVDEEVDRYYPGRFGTKVELKTTDGRSFDRTIWYAHGTSVDPCSEDEITGKFRKMCAGMLPDERIAAVEKAVRGLETGGAVSEVSRALRG